MTIGFMLTFFDFRNDVRSLIKHLCQQHQVVLFIKKEHEASIQQYLIPGLSYRLIEERSPSWANSMLERLFVLFKRLPKSKNNYYLTEAFKAESLGTKQLQHKAIRLLRLQKKLPHFFSYDFYLSALRYSSKTNLNGIDKFIAFTEIYDDYLYARLLKEQRPLITYVYSWDHACKHVRFSKHTNYIVWNNGIADDLQELQQIESSKIKILGATQLGYMYQFRLQTAQPSINTPYFYFGCGVGITSLVEQEIEIILLLAHCIQEIYPSYLLIVRPYPNFKHWEKYQQLLAKPNIRLDDSYKQTDLSVKDADILNKFNMIHHAVAFFHVGTTLGLEACFTKTPSFLLDLAIGLSSKNSLFHFIHQFQNEKYLIRQSGVNTIKSKEQLQITLRNITSEEYIAFNQTIASQFEVKSFETLAQQIAETA